MSKLATTELSRRALQHATSVTNALCDFILGTENNPYIGGECAIFVFKVHGEGTISVRMEHTPSTHTSDKVMVEAQHLASITSADIPRLPKLLGYSCDPSSSFIALQWANGSSLEWTNDNPPPRVRENIMLAIAQTILDLLQIQRTGCSAHDWATSKITRTRIARAEAGTLPGVSIEDCQKLLHGIDDFHMPELDDAPHVLVHGDLQASNIIVEEMQMSCIIDWGFSTMIPLQFAAVYPRFLTNEPRSKGGRFHWPQHTPEMTRDRLFYLSCIKHLASYQGGIAWDYYQVLAREDEVERYWWLSAVSRLDILKAWKDR